MEAIKKIRWGSEDSWIATLASLLPFWLLSVAIMAEGFPKPLIPRELAAPIFCTRNCRQPHSPLDGMAGI
jgi:hypothetical protein